MAAIVIFNPSTGEKPVIIKKDRSEKCRRIAPIVKRMYDENPKITANELGMAIGVDSATVKRCVGLINLEEPGRVSLRSGRAPTAKELIPRVLESMKEDPKYTLSSAARKLEVDRSTVTRAVRIIKQQQQNKEI
jgi:predicted transcriptional regulator